MDSFQRSINNRENVNCINYKLLIENNIEQKKCCHIVYGNKFIGNLNLCSQRACHTIKVFDTFFPEHSIELLVCEQHRH